MFWILLALLSSTAAHAQSAPDIPLATGADACHYALIYKSMNLVGSQAALAVPINLGLCQDWAAKHGDWEAAHNSFVALDSLYDLQAAALKDQLYPNDGAPPVLKRISGLSNYISYCDHVRYIRQIGGIRC